jgi:hypothetical protein
MLPNQYMTFTKGSTVWTLLIAVLLTVLFLAVVYFQGGFSHVVHQ